MLRPPSDLPIPGTGEEMDENFKQAVEVVVQYDRASASLLQRRLSIGYARAVRLIDQLEAAGVVSPAEGSAPREVLIRSTEEIFSGVSKKEKPKEKDPFEAPKNYKVPTDINLSEGQNTPWGKQFSDVYKSSDFTETKAQFSFPVGFTEEGKLRFENLVDVGNLIIAGNPLSQKENFVDTILLTFLLKHSPDKLRFVLNDETHYLDLYNNIPHLLSPVINNYDKQVSAFKWALAEMDRRMKQFSEAGVRDIKAFNENKGFLALPYILIVSFMSYFDVEREDALVRLTGLGVRTGIHNIIVVDRTSGASLPSMIKNNIPARIVFRLTSAGESKAIDVSGAEKLELGEIIYKPNYGNTVRLKALYTPESNVKETVDAVKKAGT
jgi:DNA segregation ATPase FtsK/SpoIIIE, S-DNA-T family